MAAKVLVTGATGALGPTVVKQLLASGYAVRALCRRPPRSDLLPTGVELVYGDITDPITIDAVVEGCHFVIHMAALLHILNPSPELRQEYEAINVGGTANLLAAAQRHGIQRFVFYSTIAVYGHGRPEMINEKTLPQPDSYYGNTKLAAEQLVSAARRHDGTPLGVILRLAAVYGAGIKGNYARLYHGLASGRFLPLGPGTNRRTLVHDHDVAAATLLVLTHPAAAGGLYNVTDGTVHSLAAIVAAISEALDRSPPALYLPVAPIRWSVALAETLFDIFGFKAPITNATIDKYLEEMIVDGSYLQHELGYKPRYQLITGWRQIVAELTTKQNQA